MNVPVLVTSFGQFQHVFGGLWQPSTLAYAVEQFFDNGGREALIVRVVNGARTATLSIPAGAQTLELRAVRPGTREYLRASVDHDNIADPESGEFNLTVQRVRTLGTQQVEDQEIYPRLSVLEGAEHYVGTAFIGSQLVRLAGDVPVQRPDRTLDAASGLAIGYVNSAGDGDDGAPLTDYDLIGSKVDGTGLFALERADFFNLLCIPPVARNQDVGLAVLLVASRYCRDRRALLIVDPPADWQTADEALRALRRWDFASDHAFMYFPRLLAHDKLRGDIEVFAPCGAVAGTLARGDDNAPVWAERNEDAVLRPGYRPACLVTEDRRIRLAARGVNTLRASRAVLASSLAPRTLVAGSSGPAEWQYLAPRRLALLILGSIERGTHWVVLTRPQREVRAQAQAQVEAFFDRLHADGAFGARPSRESYFVRCEEGADFQITVGFVAARAGEFRVFRIMHSFAGSSVTPVDGPGIRPESSAV